jgi:hypothetical protein
VKKNTIILVSIIIVLTIACFLFFFLKLDKNKIWTSNSIPAQKISKEEAKNDKTEIEIGYLVKMNEKSIDFISLKKSRNDDSEEEKAKNIETFNISLANPATPVTKGIDGNEKSAKLSDLKIGQEIIVAYDKETKNVISININEANKK